MQRARLRGGHEMKQQIGFKSAKTETKPRKATRRRNVRSLLAQQQLKLGERQPFRVPVQIIYKHKHSAGGGGIVQRCGILLARLVEKLLKYCNGEKRRLRTDHPEILKHDHRISRPKKSSGCRNMLFQAAIVVCLHGLDQRRMLPELPFEQRAADSSLAGGQG